MERLLSGKFDKYGCTLCIQSGAGGTEAMDWAGMLYRMYKRFAERRGFKVTIMEEIPADFGIKSVEMRIEGPFAYGYLSGEKGTHRLVRISPFNAQGKRQTSFAGIETWPILEERETENIDIPDKVCLSICPCPSACLSICFFMIIKITDYFAIIFHLNHELEYFFL